MLDCKRVNVFIGKPNVGKSNILEALGLCSSHTYNEQSFGGEALRYKSLYNLFYDADTRNAVEIHINGLDFFLHAIRIDNENLFEFDVLDNTFRKKGKRLENQLKKAVDENEIQEISEAIYDLHYFYPIKIEVSESGVIKLKSEQKNKPKLDWIKRYDFKQIENFNDRFNQYLLPTQGKNLFEIVNHNEDLRTNLGKLFKEQELEFVLDTTNLLFEIQKRKESYVYKYPYSSIADTFQRFIFYLAAIESNKDSVLIFEEPEVHSFPPYVKELAERMILKDDNQYFVSTHSPYLLQTFIDSLDDTQLNVYLTYYKDYQTHVKALTSEELRDIQDFGYDVFFNLRKFEPND